MWNAYHLISNRARAVCYAARNTQFRALTELTVNKLMQSAHSQIEALNTLKVFLIRFFFICFHGFIFNEDVLIILNSKAKTVWRNRQRKLYYR